MQLGPCLRKGRRGIPISASCRTLLLLHYAAPPCYCRYGEKIVKGSPCPRSYYKCSQQNCTAKKIVERDNNTGLVTGTEYKVRRRGSSQEQQLTAAASSMFWRVLQCCQAPPPSPIIAIPDAAVVSLLPLWLTPAAAGVSCACLQGEHNHPMPGGGRVMGGRMPAAMRPPKAPRMDAPAAAMYMVGCTCLLGFG